MKLGRILYFMAIIIMAIISIIMFENNWNFLGICTGVMSFIGLINYFDIIENNSPKFTKKQRSRRAAHFKSLTHEEQERYLMNIEKEIKEKFKK
jgi:hypothetical protein